MSCIKNVYKLWYQSSVKEVSPFRLFPVEKLCARSAGSSHWHNIKGTKMAKDALKSANFNRVIRQIRLAIHAGNGNTDRHVNRALGEAYEMAQKVNMPHTTVDKVLKSIKENYENAKPMWMEFKGSTGVIMMLLTITPNRQKTRGEVNSFVKKHNLLKTDSNVRNVFNHVGIIIAEPPADLASPDEKTVEDAIEIGAEEVVKVEDSVNRYEFACAPDVLNAARSKLAARNYAVISADEEFIPRSPITLSEEEAENINKLYEKFETIPEIVKIYDNIARDEE